MAETGAQVYIKESKKLEEERNQRASGEISPSVLSSQFSYALVVLNALADLTDLASSPYSERKSGPSSPNSDRESMVSSK